MKPRLDRLMGSGVPPFTIHDLRRTAVTHMGEMGTRDDVIELCVNHVSGRRAGVAGIYNKSVLMAERRAAMEAWSRKVLDIVEGRETTNVIDLRREA
jgi:integrase